MALSIIVLAAGHGKRMRSDLPKMLQPLAGRPILAHVISTAADLGSDDVCVVYGHGGDVVRKAFAESSLRWCLQAEQLGTGHAVQQAMPGTPDGNTVLILCGDVPLVSASSLRRLLAGAGDERLAVLTVELDDATGYGRVIRDDQSRVRRIVEDRDASDEERRVREINTGLMACPAALLKPWLEGLGNQNSQGEYYLTDVIAMAVEQGIGVEAVLATSETEVAGINDKIQLARAEASYRQRCAEQLMLHGVTLADPQRIDVRGVLQCGRDVAIDINTVFEGTVKLGDRVRIGANCVIRDCELGDDTVVHPNSVLDQARAGNACEIGPFARLRPDAVLAERARVGNFVEIKKSQVGEGSKVNHLTYIGDADIGRDVNVGAGTITCNYDGAYKHRTVIGDRAFIGSGVELVAPIVVGAGATIGAGSTVAKEVAEEQLTLERSKQTIIKGWKRPQKNSGEAK